ncbi:Sterol 24-C-methyltransferase, partial [Dissostichus eleginoides]
MPSASLRRCEYCGVSVHEERVFPPERNNNKRRFCATLRAEASRCGFYFRSENLFFFRGDYEFYDLFISHDLHVALFLPTVAADRTLRVDWSAASSLSDLALLGNTRTSLVRRLILTAPLGALDFSQECKILPQQSERISLGIYLQTNTGLRVDGTK